MTRDLRDVPHRLHSALEMATALLNLPLAAAHLEGLALELTGPVRALIAEALAEASTDSPVRYAVVDRQVTGREVDDQTGVETTEYAGCVSRISLAVDVDSPAATLAAELRRHHDVVITDVPNGTHLGLTVRPRTVQAWQWWLKRFSITADTVTVQGTNAYATGLVGDVAVHLCGEDTGTLLSSDVSVRRGLDVDLDTPAGTAAAKVRRQSDVTAIEIRNAHTIAVTVRATSLIEWQWWLTQLRAVGNPVTFEGDTAIVTGSKDGATVHLHGADCRSFYTADLAAARLMGLIAPATT